MSMAALIRNMAAAGASPEAIALAIEAIEAEQNKAAEKRAQAAARKARQRDRERDSHATVTAQECDSHSKGSLETKVPTPLKTLNPSKENPPKGGQKKGSRLPADWAASEADLAYAANQNLSGVWLDREIEKFRNYWTAKGGATAVKRDWAATWRNWVLSAVERGPPHGQGPPSGRGSLTDAAIDFQHETRRPRNEPPIRTIPLLTRSCQ